MHFNDVIAELRNRHDNHQSLPDQVLLLTIHQWLRTTGPDGEFLSKRDMREILDELGFELECSINVSHRNLVEAGYLETFQHQHHPEWWFMRLRDWEVVYDKEEAAVKDETSRAISHIESMDPPEEKELPAIADGSGEEPELNEEGLTLREEIQDRLDIKDVDLEDYLLKGSIEERRENLNEVVDAVSDSETFEKPDSYDKITFIPRGNRYHRSEALQARLT